MKNNVKTISLCLGLASLTFGQTGPTTTAPIYNASIVAGIPTGLSQGDGGLSQFGVLSLPQGIIVDSSGNIFIADNNSSRIRRIDAVTGILTTFALNPLGSACTLPGTGAPNTQNCLSNPNGMAFDSKGNLLVAQSGNSGMILRIDPKGVQTVLAGTNVSATFGGDGQYAFNSVLNAPGGVAVDRNDNIYFTDSGNNRVRMIKNVNNCIFTPGTLAGNNVLTNTCTITTIAGEPIVNPQLGSACGATNTCTPSGNNTVGDGGPALTARVQSPYGIAVTPDGSMVYVSQAPGNSSNDHRIRAINMNTGIITSLIGNCLSNGVVIPCASGNYGNPTTGNSFGDGRPSTMGTVYNPRGLYLDSVNNLLYFADGGIGANTSTSANTVSGANTRGAIRVINLNTGIVNTAVGGGSTTGDSGTSLNSGLLTSLSLNNPWGVWVQNGLIYFVEQAGNKVRVADPVGQTVSTLVGVTRTTGSGGMGTNAYLGFATALGTTASPRVGVDKAGNVYIVEASVSKIRKLTPDGTINDWAGTGATGFNGDGGPAVAARLSAPQSVAFDAAGNGYIADTGNNRIRKVDTNGIITTIVGRDQVSCAPSKPVTTACDKSNYAGDGTAPSNAVLSGPQGVAVDGKGNLVIADTGHNSIRYADLTNMVVTTISGGVPAGVPDGPNDGRSGLGTAGQLDSTNALLGLLNAPRGVAVDAHGNIYIADYSNSVAREMSPTGGGYSLFSFYGSGSSSGTAPNAPTGATGQASVPARIRISSNNATSVAVDAGNNIYYALAADSRVHVISADHSRVYLVGGGGLSDTGANYNGTNVFNIETPNVTGVAVDSQGNVYTADRTGVVRKFACTANCLPLQ